MEKTKDKNLFGEANEVYNALHSEVTFINEEIDKVQKSIDKSNEKIEKLEERKVKLQRAIIIQKKSLKGISQTKLTKLKK